MGLETTDILLRLAAAMIAGMAIGLNRDLTNKPIGMRTLALVALGTAAVTVASIDFPGMASNPDAMSRIVQGVIQGLMTGISFIGAGVILRDAGRRVVEGLTTAATVWVTAALGIACGLGAWSVLAAALGLALFVLVGVGWAERRFWPEAWDDAKADKRRALLEPDQGEGSLAPDEGERK